MRVSGGPGQDAGGQPVTDPPPLLTEVDREARRAAVLRDAEHVLDGIDFVEVVANLRGSPGRVEGAPEQRTLLVHLLRGPVPADLDRRPRRRQRRRPAGPAAQPGAGGVGLPGPCGGEAGRRGPRPGDAAAGRHRRRPPPSWTPALPAGAATRQKVLVVRTSTQRRLVDLRAARWARTRAAPPAGFDEPLAERSRSGSPSTARATSTAPAGRRLRRRRPSTAPAGLPRPRLRRAAHPAARPVVHAAAPAGRDRNPADPAVMLVELFAAPRRPARVLAGRGRRSRPTSATARQRTSVRRHARLLDYRVHEGCSARAWLAVTTDVVVTLAARRAGAAAEPVADGSDDPLPVDVHDCRRGRLRDLRARSASTRGATSWPSTPGATPTTSCRPGRRPRSSPFPSARTRACARATSSCSPTCRHPARTRRAAGRCRRATRPRGTPCGSTGTRSGGRTACAPTWPCSRCTGARTTPCPRRCVASEPGDGRRRRGRGRSRWRTSCSPTTARP